MKKIIFFLATLSLVSISSLSVTGCNTVAGAGKDVERGGEKVQDASEAVKKKL